MAAVPEVGPSSLSAYNASDFAKAEASAAALIVRSAIPTEVSARAPWVQAFAAARRGRYALARGRFAQLRREAAGRAWTVPAEDFTTEAQRAQREDAEWGIRGERGSEANSDPGEEETERRRGPDGQLLPTLEEEAAYQEAVLSGMPDGGFRSAAAAKAAAPAVERALLAFMRQYPESPLAAAARWRIMHRHQGELPKEAERVWRAAQATARKRREAGALRAQKARSLCGPLLAAEVLRRWGAPPEQTEVPALARELSTDYVLDGQSVVPGALWAMVNGVVDRTYLHGARGPEYERSGSSAPVWYLYDGLGSVLGTVDAAGNLVSTRKYDVYGAVRGSTGPSGSKHKWVGGLGHPSEDETGLVYMRARYYDPVTGRFPSEDPAKDGANWFEYARSSPLNYSDLTGEFPFTWEQVFAALALDLKSWATNTLRQIEATLRR